jgi:stage II sporulation protein D
MSFLGPPAFFVALLVGLVATPLAAAQGSPEVSYRFEGRGYGHGVGMSQYGARGAAAAGLNARAILAHYYRGTTLATVPRAVLRVRLIERRRRASVGAGVAFTARPAGGQSVLLPAKSSLRATAAGRIIRLTARNGAVRLRGTSITLIPRRGGALRLNGRRYRGALVLQSVPGSRLNVINRVDLERYLLGVVPKEVPAHWGDDTPEALRAQAIAARTYALALRRPLAPGFDLRSTVRAQVYGGRDAEDRRTTAAVRATRGQVLTFEGKIIPALFFSTSGGRTENVENIFGGHPLPYLTSVPDPYDAGAPYHRRWPDPPTVSAARLGRLLGLGGPVASFTITRRGVSPRVLAADVVTTDGVVHAMTGEDVRRALGLRDTWFRVIRTRTRA